MAFDIIGDIHGQADKLEALLRVLGYRELQATWRHSSRQAIFALTTSSLRSGRERECLPGASSTAAPPFSP